MAYQVLREHLCRVRIPSYKRKLPEDTLSQIVKGLKPIQLAILVKPCEEDDWEMDADLRVHVDEFILRLHQLYFKSVIFYDTELFFGFVEASLAGSIESVNLIFRQPAELTPMILERKLAHRLSLFIFYWGARQPPKRSEITFREPMRAVVITRPRKKAFRIYYNQAHPDGNGHLSLVSWYDGDNLGLSKEPLLPPASNVYSNFHGRIFRVPVFHSPPWFWVNYENETSGNSTLDSLTSDESYEMVDDLEMPEVNVTGGRDHRLLQLLAEHMHFEFVYIDTPGRTQGSLTNETFTGGIGLLQNGLGDFFLGDVSLSWERRKAIEFSFFTLADSGAFATHAPRRLNEALAILRPFKADVWPYLILTVIVSGPVFYFIIYIPFRWQTDFKERRMKRTFKRNPYHMVYIREITRLDNKISRRLACEDRERDRKVAKEDELPDNLFYKCIWFTVQLFLKQSCQELYHGYRAKFLMIVYWIAATYVLADVYSAQLTSQFARPAREPPINTLHRLQKAMIQDGYLLFVERESSSLEMLENGTEIFRQLYALMKLQSPDEEGYLIDSVEAGMHLIADGLENKAVLGGRETLYFNIQQYGSKTFQLSQKLYTRYSAVAVQIGCPFLDSLNNVLIHLFEGGILDKMTTAEYETQSRMITKDMKKNHHNNNQNKNQKSHQADPAEMSSQGDETNSPNESQGKTADNAEMKKPQVATTIIQPLNLRMLQGAFIVLIVGYTMAALMLFLELFCHGMNPSLIRVCKNNLHTTIRCLRKSIWKRLRWLLLRIWK
ncbi:ionotropic receptor 40a [Musca vetustissima]|uniref:ionotropic receptor 40a n=1 Tax=Musca vetustissima TaxID=27455 RepID=UPI002AB74287|nr:ionotropic receptor 40a [Musca vetustissima]